MYKVITKANGKFGVQRVGSVCLFGDFDTWGEAFGAASVATVANKTMRSE